MLTALIDADIVAYRAAASAENEPLDIAIIRADRTMRDILDQLGAPRYRGFISGPLNFRKIINPQYKANRTQPRPKHLLDVQSYLVADWNCTVTNGNEADDELGMAQGESTIICSIDKDLKQIPGQHFNWVTGEYDDVTELQGLQFFWKQMMIGDTADNIVGVDRIGKKIAGRLIDPIFDPKMMFQIVYDKYNGDLQRFLLNGVCLYVWQNEEPNWLQTLNRYHLGEEFVQEVEAMSKSMKSLMEGTSMEPIMIHQLTSGFLVSGTEMEAILTENAG